ncbi:MAG: PD40 domain-containing protein [Pseudomonadales bacterium]|nr:PD40 domain-containing protein [Pseudomonadales bacterium]
MPIAYIQRSVPADEDGILMFTDHSDPMAFNPGAAVYVQRRASANVQAENITAELYDAGALYDVRDLSSSDDGKKLLFSMRAPELPDVDDIDQPKWNIWQYDIEQKQLIRIIASDIIAEDANDIMPRFLPDGHIVFSSTRQRGINAIRLDESKPQFPALDQNRQTQATVLHVMEADGSNIEQITYNVSHDMYPAMLTDGRIVFSRLQNDAIDLYTVKPDGSEVQLLYGNKSHDTGTASTPLQFLKPQPQLDGTLLIQATPFDLNHFGSNWFFIDHQNFINIDQAINNITATDATTQTALFVQDIPSEDEMALSGRYVSVYDLADGTHRFLVTWNACRLNDLADSNSVDLICSEENLADNTLSEGPNNASLWIYDANTLSQKPVYIPPTGQMVSEAIALNVKTPAAFIAPEQSLENWGTLKIRSVYDMDGVDSRLDASVSDFNNAAASFLRITKSVGIPDDDTFDFSNTAFGRANEMQQILGYVPIAADGSVEVRVPANVPFKISILDASSRRLHRQRHTSWLQLRPGETLACNGCHDGDNDNPHGRPDLVAPSIISEALTLAENYTLDNALRELTADIIGDAPSSINLLYTDLNTEEEDPDYLDKLPITVPCLQSWEIRCRITLHYIQHIQPLWDKARNSVDPVDPNIIYTHRCTACHNRTGLDGLTRIPAGQLELTSQPSDRENEHLTSYRELLFADNEQAFDAESGLLVDIDTDPVEIGIQGIRITPVMNRNGSAFSARFFERFESPLNPTHFGHLTPIELKLISEWLDIGGQYYNNPFEAPEN